MSFCVAFLILGVSLDILSESIFTEVGFASLVHPVEMSLCHPYLVICCIYCPARLLAMHSLDTSAFGIFVQVFGNHVYR